MTPHLSVVLPVYNRTAVLAHPLDSLRAAAAAAPGLAWELIVVDDGSTEDVVSALAPYRDLPLALHRLPVNSGLLAARLAGLAQACGEAVCFLDGDDAVAPGKFTAQLSALANADVVYGDVARRTIDANGRPAGPLRDERPLSDCSDPAEFYLGIQPGPHNPIFRRSYLQAAVDPPLFPPQRTYDSIAETWFYYLLAVRPARIVRLGGCWSIVGEHDADRLSRCWERQAAASLRLMRSFARACPAGADTITARQRVGRCAFSTWRAFPRGFPPADAFLDVWRQLPRSPVTELGGATFARLARWLGPVVAGRLLRFWQRPSYRKIRTIDDGELRRLFTL